MSFNYLSSSSRFLKDESTFQFDISKIKTYSGRLNPEMLDECNRLELIDQLKDPAQQEHLVKEAKELVRKTFPNDINNLDLDNDHIKYVLEWSLDHITNINQIVEKDFAFIWVLPPTKSSHNLSQGNLSQISISNNSFLSYRTTIHRSSEKTCTNIGRR